MLEVLYNILVDILHKKRFVGLKTLIKMARWPKSLRASSLIL